jgi:xanthine dehydrogenase accessory factor
MDPPQPPPRFLRGSADPVEITRTVLSVLDGSRPGPAAVATVVQRAGSAPQATGAKLVMLADETLVGTVGGGAIEAQVIDACRTTLRDGRSRKVAAHLVRDLGMCCGGSMEVFVEYVQAQARLIIVGGGHVAQALAPLAHALGFRVTVADDREEMLESPAFSTIERLHYDADEIDEALPDLGAHDLLLIMTRDHARDERALAKLLERPHAYLGMIGSRRKVHTVLARILRRYDERGLPRPDMSRVHAPIGLALGGRTPPEIAVSIAAELVALRHGGDGSSMNVIAEVLGK